MGLTKITVKNWLSVTSHPKKGFRATLVQNFFLIDFPPVGLAENIELIGGAKSGRMKIESLC